MSCQLTSTIFRNTHSNLLVLLFLPYPSSNPQLQFFLVASREEECHVPLDDESVVAIPNRSVTVPYASWGTLPSKFAAIPTNFQTVGVVSSIGLVTHISQKSHIYRSHAKLKSFKVETEVLSKTMEDLKKKGG